jgi:nucleoside-diphosphate-sugar epimerase
MTAKNDRLHPMAAYGIARYYRDLEQYDLYVKYLVEASESDGICQLKETAALQKLSYFLYETDKDNSKRATRYIQHSMEDAQFFNNRLRMIEISNILPVIVTSNQEAAERSRTRMEIGLICACVILTIILILTVVNTKQKNSLKKNRKEIAAQNKQLAELNQRLMDTNKRRETYMSLFMDISALYIRKLDDYRKLVSRKVKAKQTEDWETNPLGVYGKTKLAGEKSIEATGCKHIIIRTAWLYSQWGKNFVKTMQNLTASHDTLKVVFDQVGTPTYAGDLAAVISHIIETNQLDKTGIYHFSNEGVCSWFDFAKIICELSGNTCDIQPCYSEEFPSPVKRPHFSVLDKSKLKQTFGFKVPYWTDSLKKCIAELAEAK